MRTKLKFKRNWARDLMRSPGVLADLERRAANVAAAAGPGHEVRSEVGKIRPRAAVVTARVQAIRAEAESKNLTSALDAGKD